MRKVVIFGIGEIASVAHFYITHDSPYEVAAFTVDRPFLKGDKLEELPVIPFDEIENAYPPDKYEMFLPISYRNINKLRAEKYHQAKDKGYKLISYVSSKATIWPGFICGDNCFILEDNTIQPFVQIGNNVILWSGNHIGHHTVIKDHCFISSQVVISGSVTIEPYCFLGVNATIRDGITIARECVIGAGSLILNDTAERAVYRGSRTKPLRYDSSRLTKI